MTMFSGAVRRFSASFAVFAAALATPIAAQDEFRDFVAVETTELPASLQLEDPWLYRGTDIPQDKAWLFGELDNGLRYAVRDNGVPPGQVSIRIRIDAGSMHETSLERGYAHLLEHLLFRESKYLTAGEAISRWQRLGATFGSDTNAETTPTHTVYKLDLPNVDEAKLDESMRLLSGMIREPALSANNLAVDVPIVLAEVRENGGATRRIFDASRETFFEGQLYAERPPSGTPETLRGASPQSIQAFHTRWYRPDNAQIVVVGDADPILMAQLVETYFADWQAHGPLAPEPDFGAPQRPPGAAGDPPVGTARVLVEPDLPRNLQFAVLRPWEQVTDNLEYNRGLLIDAIAQAILNRRLESRARGGGSYLVASVEQDDIGRSTDATYVSVTPLGEDWQSALREVREVIADALVSPPSEEEIARELAEFDIVFVNMVEQEQIQASRDLANTITQALDIREAVASPETVLAVFRDMRGRFTPEAVLEHTRRLFEGEVVRALYVTPSIGEVTKEELRAVLVEEVEAGARGNGTVAISFAELPPVGQPQDPVSIERLGGIVLPIEQLTFANGVRAQVWRTTNEPGRATVLVRFGKGYREIRPEDGVQASLGQMALVASGLGDLGEEELDRIASGRKLGFEFSIGEAAFELRGETRADDVADQLYLFAAKLAMPRWEENPFLRARAAARLAYDSYGTEPAGVLERDLDWLLRDRDPRFARPTPQALDAATHEGFRRLWEPILAHGPVEVMVYGDIDFDGTVAALSRTFGALPARSEVPDAELIDASGFPAPRDEPLVLTHRGEADQAAAVVAWPTGGGMDDLAEGRQLEILSQVFGNRLLEAMRERAGASYAPSVVNDWPVDIDDGGSMMAIAQLQPGETDAFFAEVDAIARDLAENGPSEDEITRVTEPFRQLIQRAITGHGFWMSQFKGASFDLRKVNAMRNLLRDYTETSPESQRALAQRYFGEGRAWRLAVMPERHKEGR